MAWNRPSEEKVEAKDEQMSIHLKGLIAGTVIVLVAGLIAWLIFSGSDDTHTQDTKSNSRQIGAHSTIREVSPASASKPVEENPKIVDPNARPTRPGQKLNGYVMLPNGTLHEIKGPYNPMITPKDPSSIFDNAAENIVANILTIEPGGTLVGKPNYDGMFTKSFLESIKNVIVVKEDDPEEVKELKRAVNQAKIELKLAYDRGEDIEQMIYKAREDAQRLSLYKQELRKEVLKFADNETHDPADVEDCIKAANMMLEARGIAPIEDTPLNRVRLGMKEYTEEEQ